MSPAERPEIGDKLIQSYVLDRWFVSTARRLGSAPLAPDMAYWETIAWEWDRVTKATGKMIDCREGGLTHHLDICRRLVEGKPLEDPDE